MIEFIQLSSDTVMIGIEFVYHYFDNQINSRWGGGWWKKQNLLSQVPTIWDWH